MRRRGRTIGTIVVGLAILVSLAALFFPEQLGWRTMPHPVKKAAISQDERNLAVGASVRTAEGITVGAVSGISRAEGGHIERIRVTTVSPAGQRIVSLRSATFTIDGNAVQLNLTLAEVNALPAVMTNDRAAALWVRFKRAERQFAGTVAGAV
jgi:hypothetical protein